jgi:hypothetical protein
MSLDLYSLESRYQDLCEIAPEPEKGAENDFSAVIDAIQDDAARKALSLARVVKVLEAEVHVLEEETRLLQTKAHARRERVALLRHRIQLELEASGRARVRDAVISLWLQQSPPAVEVIDLDSVPPEFLRAVLRLPYDRVPADLRGHVQHLDVDRQAIHEAVQRTSSIPVGVRIRTGEKHLRIR